MISLEKEYNTNDGLHPRNAGQSLLLFLPCRSQTLSVPHTSHNSTTASLPFLNLHVSVCCRETKAASPLMAPSSKGRMGRNFRAMP
jgi:hypothetical protein